ncbi:hypothetical protein [Vallicoccus soli]|uniref:Uncharacterized protein n=1 Tax=Vallicoccus soli TaxID=2339232 RepID=A0A3A3Z0D2_9ACTN|nr:hypothetical protein [Vallicoccus soli]RJK97709.1 hypothetical protein D5H78_01485 [Vallicoccus soli]
MTSPEPAPPGPAEVVVHVPTVPDERTWAQARCPCGWAGPRRRAVASAHRDAERHAAEPGA